jgi:aminocarboxymuconate-semialdehyde decarboxylase
VNHGIDVHTHIVPENFPAYAGSGRDVPWPAMQHDKACGHAYVMISGSKYRTVPDTSWDTAKRAGEMDAISIACQVLSPMPELLSYWLPLADAKALIRWLNETIAGMVAAQPSRFIGLGAVPLQDIDAAIAELESVLGALEFSGAEIASHVNGVSIGDARFEPFFAAAEKMGAAVFVHALRPAGKDRLVGPSALEQVVAFPGDIGLAAASMITGGTAERHPGLRIAFSHGGGALPIMLPRIDHGWNVNPAIRETMAHAPSETARNFYCDTLTYNTATLKLALDTFGDDKIMIGTDYPFIVKEPDPHARVASLKLDAARDYALREGNAKRFLALAG